MAKKNKAKRAQVEVDIECVHCKQRLHVQIFRDVITPAVKADVELRPIVTADNQARLFDDDTPAAPKATAEPAKVPGDDQTFRGIVKGCVEAAGPKGINIAILVTDVEEKTEAMGIKYKNTRTVIDMSLKRFGLQRDGDVITAVKVKKKAGKKKAAVKGKSKQKSVGKKKVK